MESAIARMFDGKFNNLTVARFAAAVFVLFHHLPPLHQWLCDRNWLRLCFIAQNGYVGVTLFFILSGFILTHVYSQVFEAELRFKDVQWFYFMRVTRVVPLWLFLSAIFLLGSAVPITTGWFLYFLMLQAWSPSIGVAFSFIGVAWTLSVEAFFYLVFPFLIWSFRRLRIGSGLLICSIGFVIPVSGSLIFEITSLKDLPITDPSSFHRWLYRMPLLRVGDFIVGIGLYYFMQSILRVQNARVVIVIGALSIGFGMAVVSYLMMFTTLSHWTVDTAYVAPFGAVILGLALMEAGAHSLRVRSQMLILLGEASYALYLVHSDFVIKLLQPVQTSVSLNPLLYTSWIIIFATSLSVGLHILVEMPCQRALRQLAGRVAKLPTMKP